MKNKKGVNAFASEPMEDVNLSNPMFGEGWCNELKEIDKHEIIVKICDTLGPSPTNLNLAEKIFEEMKFDITRYVIHHEYCRCNSIRSKLLLWLDSKTHPAKAEMLTNFMDKYLK